MYKNTRKEDPIVLLQELGLELPPTPTIATIKGVVESSDIFEADKESVQDTLNNIVEERRLKFEVEAAQKIEEQKIELERIKLAQLERKFNWLMPEKT